MSSTPTPYTRQANFTSFEASNPSKPKPGASLDAEFNAVRTALDTTQSRLAEIQRDDGALANASVGNDQFKDEVDFGFNSIGDWETNRYYVERDGVWHNSIFYRCLIAHQSGVFESDLVMGRWKELVDFKSHEDAAAASAQAAADSAQDSADSAQDSADSAAASQASAIAAAGSAGAASASATQAGTYAANASASATAASVSAGNASDSADAAAGSAQSAANSAIEAANSAAAAQLSIPTGAVIPFAGSSAPSGWLLCYGQEVSRATYSELFAAIGTTYGVGDGSTTFELPDLRGRVPAGKDDMGGTAASRLTDSGTGNPGIDGATLGAAGGADRHTLTTAQMPAHTHNAPAGGAGSSAFTADGSGGDLIATDSQGGDEAHPNVQPTIVLNYIIKA